mgnify:CR=1 FL=1
MNEKIQKVAGLVATGKFWKEAIIMTLGMMVAAAAVYYFLVPSKLIIGTVSGLSIVLSGIFETFFGIQIKVSLFVVIINAILLVLAWLLIGEEFGAKTVYTAMILGPLMDFWLIHVPMSPMITILNGLMANAVQQIIAPATDTEAPMSKWRYLLTILARMSSPPVDALMLNRIA